MKKVLVTTIAAILFSPMVFAQPPFVGSNGIKYINSYNTTTKTLDFTKTFDFTKTTTVTKDSPTVSGHSIANSGKIEDSQLVTGSNNLVAGDDLKVTNTSALGDASNTQQQSGFNVPNQSQGQVATANNTAISGDYAPFTIQKTVLGAPNSITAGFGSTVDNSNVLNGSNSGVVANGGGTNTQLSKSLNGNTLDFSSPTSITKTYDVDVDVNDVAVASGPFSDASVD